MERRLVRETNAWEKHGLHRFYWVGSIREVYFPSQVILLLHWGFSLALRDVVTASTLPPMG